MSDNENQDQQQSAVTDEAVADVAQEPTVATPDIVFLNGILHQRVMVQRDGSSAPAWRRVPSVDTLPE